MLLTQDIKREIFLEWLGHESFFRRNKAAPYNNTYEYWESWESLGIAPKLTQLVYNSVLKSTVSSCNLGIFM